MCTMTSTTIVLFCVFLSVAYEAEAARIYDYVAPENPCRREDRFCSVKCSVLELTGDVNCEFCVCEDKNNYVKWDTTPDPRLPIVVTTLPPDVHVVNNIWYHMVHNPCDMVSDRVCPMKCTEKPLVKPDGSDCIMCDCQGAAVLIG